MFVGDLLFGNATSQSQNRNIVEFKAGKMYLKDKMVYPDTRKGLVYIYQSEDLLIHFCWKDRKTFKIEDDLIIFPGDFEFKKVPQCTTGRVYILKFKSSSRKFFFWLQEPKTDKDEELCYKVNDILNNPQPVARDSYLQNMMSPDEQQQWLQLFSALSQNGDLPGLLGNVNISLSDQNFQTRSSSTAVTTFSTTASSFNSTFSSETTSSTTSGTNIQQNSLAKFSSGNQKRTFQLSDLQNFFSEFPAPPSKRSSNTRQNVDLASSFSTRNLQTILRDPNLVNRLQQHLPTLPGDSETSPTEQLISTITSPQFQESVSMFSTALQSGELGPVVQQFGMGPEAVTAAQQGNMEDFMKALEEYSINKDNEKDDESVNSKRLKKSEDKEDNLH